MATASNTDSESESPRAVLRFELSHQAKDEVYDFVSQIFHDTAALWQFVDQGDPEEAVEMIAAIRGRCDEIHAAIAQRPTKKFPEFVAGAVEDLRVQGAGFNVDQADALFCRALLALSLARAAVKSNPDSVTAAMRYYGHLAAAAASCQFVAEISFGREVG